MDESEEFSDGLDEFEESMEERKSKPPPKTNSAYNKPYDEAFEVSNDLSVAESYDFRDKQPIKEKEKKLKNDIYDEAVEVSQSLDQVALSRPGQKQEAKDSKGTMDSKDAKGMGGMGSGLTKGEQTRSQSYLNNTFDEALEFSQSESEESIDTARGKPPNLSAKATPSTNSNKITAQPIPQTSQRPAPQTSQNTTKAMVPSNATPTPTLQKPDDDESSAEADHEESYEHIEGAYNPKDFFNLNVTSEVKDLFQYIERYKPQEVELDTPLKCFIPEYIPAIGELDPFIKIPRPDGKEDGSGLKYIDEPSANQSDPTVLELQLRAKSKKLQYGDVVVRSIENADKNPTKIDKWIQDINELHRSKPPPQVNYKKNMPDFDKLMEAWPEEFEQLLATTPLPSPDLDLSLADYAKALCNLLDIPVYDNPIESLHLMFTLYLEFKNNPHFQSRLADNQADAKNGGAGGAGNKYGGADVLEINDYQL